MTGAVAKDEISTSASAQRRVLYAEDSMSSRVVTTAMLKRMGFLVDAVEDGELALELAKINDYDLILLDVEMPVMDGVTAARCIRSETDRHAATPILALSAFLADSTEFSVWRDAFDSALPKPANSNELLTAMNRAIAKRAPQDIITPKIIVNPAIQGSLIHGLRLSLPRVTFAHLMATAADEMRHGVLVMSTSLEAQDAALFTQAAKALSGLAGNFDNQNLIVMAKTLEARGLLDTQADDLLDMLAAVEGWLADCWA